MGVAAAHPGASASDVADGCFLDALAGTAALNGAPVRVEAVSPAAAAPLTHDEASMRA